jgi:hypothetical protein
MGIATRLRVSVARLRRSVRTHTRKTVSWLRAIRSWVWRSRSVWTTFHWIAFLAVISAVGFSVYRPYEQSVRYAGLGLQLLGIGMVAWGIRETRDLFGHPTFFLRARRWLSDFPPYGGRIVSVSAQATLGVAIARARGSVWSTAGADATVEQRLNALEKNLRSVRDDLSQCQKEIDENLLRHENAINKERESRATADGKIRNLLTTAETSGLYISAMGAFLLFLGVIMSTIPPELASLLQN